MDHLGTPHLPFAEMNICCIFPLVGFEGIKSMICFPTGWFLKGIELTTGIVFLDFSPGAEKQMEAQSKHFTLDFRNLRNFRKLSENVPNALQHQSFGAFCLDVKTLTVLPTNLGFPY